MSIPLIFIDHCYWHLLEMSSSLFFFFLQNECYNATLPHISSLNPMLRAFPHCHWDYHNIATAWDSTMGTVAEYKLTVGILL